MPSLPFVGKKVDTIDHCREEYVRLTKEIEEDQQLPEKFPLTNSAFMQFTCPVTAHMICQSVNHHKPQYMTPRYIEIWPDNVLWENMTIGWWGGVFRTILMNAAIVGLIVGCVIPATFTGLLSQIVYLTTAIPQLGWVTKLP